MAEATRKATAMVTVERIGESVDNFDSRANCIATLEIPIAKITEREREREREAVKKKRGWSI